MTSAPDHVARKGWPLGRRAKVALSLSFVVLSALTFWRSGTSGGASVQEFVGPTMGTSFSVKIDADLLTGERERVRDVVEQRLDEVNRLMSTYDSTSELSRFNRHLSTDPFAVSAQLIEVLALAFEVSQRSGGAFDVTVAPLVDAWGFGPADRTHPPDEAQLPALRERVGYEQILVNPEAGTIAKTTPETRVDLSAIAKGFGVERVASALVELGFTRFLVEVGGELKAVGARRDGSAWRVGIEKPDPAVRAVYGVVDLVDQAMATSGDYRNFHESDAGPYAHIIDPRTGTPIGVQGASVSVAHTNAALADAWATALMVLGPEEGYELAEREGIAALFVMQSDGGFQSLPTPAFVARLRVVVEVERR